MVEIDVVKSDCILTNSNISRASRMDALTKFDLCEDDHMRVPTAYFSRNSTPCGSGNHGYAVH